MAGTAKKATGWLNAQFNDMSPREAVAFYVLACILGAAIGVFTALRLGPIASVIIIGLSIAGLVQCIRLLLRHRS
jgi:hypothetical protein